MQPSLTVLVVLPVEQDKVLLSAIGACRVEVVTARTCDEAALLLRNRANLRVVFTGLFPQDRCWRRLYNELLSVRQDVQVVICLPTPDGGITDLLESGAAAVVVPPYNEKEMFSVIGAVTLRSGSQALRASPSG